MKKGGLSFESIGEHRKMKHDGATGGSFSAFVSHGEGVMGLFVKGKGNLNYQMDVFELYGNDDDHLMTTGPLDCCSRSCNEMLLPSISTYMDISGR